MTFEQMVMTMVLRGWRVWVDVTPIQGHRDTHPIYCHPGRIQGCARPRDTHMANLRPTTNFIHVASLGLWREDPDWFHPDIAVDLPIVFERLMELTP